MQLVFEKLRKPLSRVIAFVGLVLVCSTNSYWEKGNEAVSLLLFLIGVFLVAVASLGRMWCSLYIAGYKDKELITKGPYSLCRNPLYFFSMLGMLGVGFATETLVFPLVLLIAFSVYYPFVIKSEEKRLKGRFGPAFAEYSRRVPSFFPSRACFDEPSSYNVNPRVYRKHIFSALWFVWIVGILEVIEGLREMGILGHFWTSY